jgi:prepilin-type N-terminal cleavage/methylation domain-containing protein
MKAKGFTLVELLVVVAIIAIIAVVVVLTINPTELLRQARDANRSSDIGTLNKIASLYYSDAINSPSTMFMGTSSVIYISVPDPNATSTAGNQCQGLGLPTPPTGLTYQCAATSTYMKTDGTGWLPINLTSYPGGTIVSKLPVDPTNTTSTNLYYTYETDGIGGYKITAFFESQKDAPLMGKDSGNDPLLYEKGTNLALVSGRGLVGYWPMDEGTGSSTIDVSGDGDIGTWAGTAAGTNGAYYTAGKVGSYAGFFNGSNDKITSADTTTGNFGTSDFSGTGWYNTTSTALGYIIDKRSLCAYGSFWSIDINSGVLGVEIDQSVLGNYSSINDVAASNDGLWHFFTFTRRGTTASFYRDGNFIKSATTAGTPNISNTANILVGQSICSAYFSGSLDDVRIYNRALSAAEIQEMYNAEK